jgi:hypothetical protein
MTVSRTSELVKSAATRDQMNVVVMKFEKLHLI